MACVQVNIRFGPPREDPIVDPSKVQPIPLEEDPKTPQACFPEVVSPPGDGFYDLPPNTIEATYYYSENEMPLTIPIPDGVINRTTWVLYDLISSNPTQQWVNVRILIQ